ncbi:MAG: DUF2169 domain-containing protein [Methyloprofundus sp.]|nr:DUF2169 domain-containing protein [Methyloprofundus sp.]
MDLLNSTQMQAGYTMGMEPSGRELLVVVVKGTFTIPQHGEEAKLAEEQIPLIEADTCTGEAGFSAPIYEADYAPIKAKCDVLLLGSAYAPQGEPAHKVQVGIKLGDFSKTLIVTGARQWTDKGKIDPNSCEEFTVMPFSYDNAYGGLDNFHTDESKHSAYMPNPIGKGFYLRQGDKPLEGIPVPQTEDPKQAITKLGEDYQAMALGSIGRGWAERIQYAGTYDQDWIDNCAPFLPADFNPAYYQFAPEDQQIPYPIGGEEVILINLTPAGRTEFKLPKIAMPVVFFPTKGEQHKTEAVLDTIVIEADKGVFSMTWRTHIPLKKNIFEIQQVLVGKMSNGWWRARKQGKTYHPTLAHLAKANKIAKMEEES